ncbi:kin of IRRE-like protein 1 [Mytilus edulis]|uniref:kin of IRRE-like protein 1 n=1 Tax=Mytilus edulis TaxID=6550 RepID=UPI0039EF0BC6
MKIICRILWFSCVHLATTFATVGYVYHSEGETAVLKCLPEAFNVDWVGPSHDNLATSLAEEPDIYGKKRNWTFSPYFNKNSFDPKLPNRNRLQIVGLRDAGYYNLEIRNVSLSDEGFYKCDVLGMNGTVESHRYILQINAPPSEMEFLNSTNDGKIAGIEQKPLSVVCRVKRGKPPEELTLKIDGTVINTSIHGIIEYKFTANRMDNHKQFVCEAKNMLISDPVSKTVKIELKYKPIVTIKDKVNVVNEGKTISLCSYVDSNPAPDAIWWSRGYNRLFESFNITSSCFVIANITRNNNGTYTCTAKNQIGEGSTTSTVIVKYPPNVKIKYKNVTIDIRKRNMQCIADGIPTEYTYSPWEHRSEYNELIRYLDFSSKGKLILPSTESKSDRYQDSGIYICRVSNGIPDGNSNYEQAGKGYFVSEGPPVIVHENSPKQYALTGQQVIIKLNVLSYSDIICKAISKVNGMLEPTDPSRITIEPVKVMDVFHGENVSVNGLKIAFYFTKLTSSHFQMYNITVCNMFGNQSYVVKLISSNKEETDRKRDTGNITVPIVLASVVVCFAIILIIIVKRKKRTNNRNIDENVEGLAEPVENIMYHSVQQNQTSMMPSPVSTLLPDNTSSNGTVSDTGTIAHSNGIIGQSMESRLNYADVMFEPSGSQDPARIIGLDDRTVYADVDISLGAQCPSGRQSNTSSSEDDFVYIDGIENYIEKREAND